MPLSPTWRQCSADRPCVHCHHPHYCTYTECGSYSRCMRVNNPGADVRKDANGTEYYFYDHRPEDQRRTIRHPVPAYSMADGKGERAAPEILDRVYRAFLASSYLSAYNKDQLRARGLSDQLIARFDTDLLYRSLTKNRAETCARLITLGLESLLPSIPGFFIKTLDAKGNLPAVSYWTIMGHTGLLIPVRNTVGQIIALKLRPDVTSSDQSKYLYLTSKSKKRGGAGPGAQIHVPLFPADGDRSTIRVTEGEIKADVATALTNTLTISIPGVKVWNRALSVLRELGAKRVLIALDADAATNYDVAEAADGLLRRLTELGFEPALETWPIEQGKGIDDLLARGGKPDLLAGADALRHVQGWIQNSAAVVGHGTGVEDPELRGILDDPNRAIYDPYRLAKVIAYRNRDKGDTTADKDQKTRSSTIRYHAMRWRVWNGKRFRSISEEGWRGRISGICNRQLECDFLALKARRGRGGAQHDEDDGSEDGKKKSDRYIPIVGNKLTRDVCLSLQDFVRLPEEAFMPFWVGDNGEPEHRQLVSMHNGMFDFDKFLATPDASPESWMIQHSPRWVCDSCFTYGFDATAKCPKWLAFLERCFDGDKECIRLVQQWFGYCLTHDTTQQKFLMLEGEGNNGKSVLCAVLRGLLGDRNVSALPLESFGDKFALIGTLGKLANIATEIGEMDRAAEGTLKSFVSGDVMRFEQKFKDGFEATPTARLVLATNNLPRFADRTSGLWRRMILLPMRAVIAPNERIRGMTKTGWWVEQGELPGIFNWALAGLHSLHKDDAFSIPKMCEDAVATYRLESNPARLYLQDHVTAAPPDKWISRSELYKCYEEWCQGNGFYKLNATHFGREVFKMFPGIGKKDKTGTPQIWIYRGLTFGDGIGP